MGGLCASWAWARPPLSGRLGTGAPARVSVAWPGSVWEERDLGETLGETGGWEREDLLRTGVRLGSAASHAAQAVGEGRILIDASSPQPRFQSSSSVHIPSLT